MAREIIKIEPDNCVANRILKNKNKKTDKNRTVRINRELTAMNQEVIENLESIADGYLDVIVTMNYNIDIISEEEPEIEIKS